MERRDINPKTWGSAGWEFLDSIAEGYPLKAAPEEKQGMVEFLRSLAIVIPCHDCRENYRSFVERYPPERYVEGQVQVVWWLNKYKGNEMNARLEQIMDVIR